MTEFLGDYIVVEWSGGGGIGHYSYLLTDALARAGLPAVLATREGHELEGRVPQAGRIASPLAAGPPAAVRQAADGVHRPHLGASAGCGSWAWPCGAARWAGR